MNQADLSEILANTLNEHQKYFRHTADNDDDDHHEEDDTGTTGLTVAKATAMVVLFTASTICGSIPFLLNKWFKWTENGSNARQATVVKCLLYFGGGVLLCTTFLHLLPEVIESIEMLQSEHALPAIPFHLAEFLMCIGFFAMFLVEELIHKYLHHHQKKSSSQAEDAFERGISIRDSFIIKGSNKRKSDDDTNENINNLTSSTDTGFTISDVISNDIENQKQKHKSPKEYNEDQHVSKKHNNGVHNHNDHQQPHQHPNSNGCDQLGHSHFPIQQNNNDIDEDMIVSSLRGLLVVLALSLHELFEGLAVGLESSTANVWYMFGAVSAHKLVLAFCVGVELIVSRTRLWLALCYVVTFAIVSPIGIGIGIAVSNQNSTASAIPSAILQGLATGTLLYVVFFEILSKDRSGLIAYLAFVIGFFVMFGLQFSTGHEHTHSHGHGHEHEHSHDEKNDNDQFDEKTKFLQKATNELKMALTRKLD